MKDLVPWRSRSSGPLVSLRHEMNDLFQRFFGEALDGGEVAMEAWAPRVDMEESDKEIVIKADLPGVEPKDVEISIADNMLILKGEKKEEREIKKKNYHRTERFIGQFYRQIPLPPGADPEKVSASSSKGVITITVPKTMAAQPKKVAVQVKD